MEPNARLRAARPANDTAHDTHATPPPNNGDDGADATSAREHTGVWVAVAVTSSRRVAPGTRALIAEHDPALRRQLVRALQSDGFEVREAVDGRELLDAVRGSILDDGSAPELVVTDARMPGAAVLEALAELRPVLPATTLLVITGDDADDAAEVRDAARRAGAAGVLRAPVDLDDLRTIALNAAPRGRGG